MRAAKLAVMVIAFFTIAATIGSPAQGAWTIVGKTLQELGQLSESVEVKNNTGTDFRLTGEIGATKTEITAKKLECTTGAAARSTRTGSKVTPPLSSPSQKSKC